MPLGYSCPASHRGALALSPFFLGSTKTLTFSFQFCSSRKQHRCKACLRSVLLRSCKNIRLCHLPWCVRLVCDYSSATCLTSLDMISSHTHATADTSAAEPAHTPMVHHTSRPLPLSPRMSVRPCRGRRSAASQGRRFSTCYRQTHQQQSPYTPPWCITL